MKSPKSASLAHDLEIAGKSAKAIQKKAHLTPEEREKNQTLAELERAAKQLKKQGKITPIAIALHPTAQPPNLNEHGPTRVTLLHMAVKWVDYCLVHGIPLTAGLTSELLNCLRQCTDRTEQRKRDIRDVNDVRRNARLGAKKSTKPKKEDADKTAFAITARTFPLPGGAPRSAKTVSNTYYEILPDAKRNGRRK